VAVDEDSAVWLNKVEMKSFLTASALHGKRAHALAALMLTTGARVSEVLAADVDDLGHTGGHRVLTVTRKGGRKQNLPIAPWVGRVVDEWLDGRIEGPLFATSARAGGHGRLDQPAAFRLIRKLAAAAGLPNAEQLHPHSLRHSAITGALEEGASLRDVQAMAGHADPRTTERYDRMRGRLDASPVYALAAALAD
jgi:integrase